MDTTRSAAATLRTVVFITNPFFPPAVGPPRNQPASPLAGDGWQPLIAPRLGYLSYPVWTRLRVSNSDREPKTAILYNERPLLQYLDVWVLDGEKVITQTRLGFMDSSHTETSIAGRLSSMSLRIPAGETRTVLARLETPGAMEAGWWAATVAAFSQKAMTEFIILGLYAGIMLSLIIHGAVNWINLRRVQFGFFVGYALSLLLFGLSVNGFSRIVNLGIPPGIWFAGCFLFIMGSVACFLPFTRHFLQTPHTMPRMDQWLRILCILFLASLVFFIVAPFMPQLYKYAVSIKIPNGTIQTQHGELRRYHCLNGNVCGPFGAFKTERISNPGLKLPDYMPSPLEGCLHRL